VAARRAVARILAALTAWGTVTVVGPLGGGNSTTVVEVRAGHTDLDLADLPAEALSPARLAAAWQAVSVAKSSMWAL
jgi:hypothetical protein